MEMPGTEALIEDVTVPTDPANIFSNATGKRLPTTNVRLKGFLCRTGITGSTGLARLCCC